MIEKIKSSSYVLKQFTLAILKVIESNKFNIPETKIIIDADLIPELSEELMKEYSLNQELIEKLEKLEEMNFLEPEPVKIRPLSVNQHNAIKRIGLSHPIESRENPVVTLPTQPSSGMGYEKIKLMVEDYSVSRIQCVGPGKPLVIIRAGQRMFTKIVLNQNEIYDVFMHFAEEAHIPLIEGPFKIRLDNLLIDGISSRLTDSKFIIQKQSAYSLLEHKQTFSHMPVRSGPTPAGTGTMPVRGGSMPPMRSGPMPVRGGSMPPMRSGPMPVRGGPAQMGRR